MSMWLAKKVVGDGTSAASKSLGLEDEKPQKMTKEEIKALQEERDRERERKRSKNRSRHDALRKKHGVKSQGEYVKEQQELKEQPVAGEAQPREPKKAGFFSGLFGSKK